MLKIIQTPVCALIIVILLIFSHITNAQEPLETAVTTTQADLNYRSAIVNLGAKSRKKIRNAIQMLGKLNDPKAFNALVALHEKRLYVNQEGVYIRQSSGSFINAITMSAAKPDESELRQPSINNSIRRVLIPVIAQFKLQSANIDDRIEAAQELNKRPLEDATVAIRAALQKEQNKTVIDLLNLTLAQLDINSQNKERRLNAIRLMDETGDIIFKNTLLPIMEKTTDGIYIEEDKDIRFAANRALQSIENKQFLIKQASNLFYGLSLGSILLLAALGLAITFGLMGVINMAHGEMLMLGAYTTYLVQLMFQFYFPAWFDLYLLVAIPCAFIVSGFVGLVLEKSIIRYLYGRPLETLLATWGISLILIQSVRLMFGAQNVEVANPSWLSGGWEIVQGVVIPFNRIAIILFVIFVVAMVWAMLQRTRLGLQVRAVTQNRSMAANMGIATENVDMWTFALGSGVAGLGGVALSQITNVGPELGQSYIVDSFMVVVLGGVGNIMGTVAGAMSIGIVNKFLEPISGAVLGKIFVLILIILFIQKRPQGMFALRGRAAETD